ncbi:hypothetical protein D3C81_2323190 [compost metagenome]
MAFSGTGSTRPAASAGTSNTQPWALVTSASAGVSTVSSQVSQLPQGVWPPQQLVEVPISDRC